MKAWKIITSLIISAGLLLTGCTAKEPSTQPVVEVEKPQTNASPADFAAAAKELVEGLEKGNEGKKVNWTILSGIYKDKLKSMVQARDSEYNQQVNDQLEAALNAGKEGSLSVAVVAEIQEKLLHKVAYLSLRHDFNEANEKFSSKDEAKAEIQEAIDYYKGMLKGMVEKRDNAYSTQLVGAIDSGFSEMNQSIDKGDNLQFNLGRQVVDKTMMKAFYLASGAKEGYGYKIENLVKEDSKTDIKVQQAEGWAFFQSLKTYISEHDQEDADYINKQFDLSNDVKNISGDLINQAYIRAFALTAKGEYGETFENWGKDKAAITALEGALFIDIIKGDLAKALGGETPAKALLDKTQKLLDEVKAGHKDAAVKLHKQVDAELDKLSRLGK